MITVQYGEMVYRLQRYWHQRDGGTLKDWLLSKEPHRIATDVSDVATFIRRYKKRNRINDTTIARCEQEFAANGSVMIMHHDSVIDDEVYFFGNNNPPIKVIPREFPGRFVDAMADKVRIKLVAAEACDTSDEELWRCLGGVPFWAFEVALCLRDHGELCFCNCSVFPPCPHPSGGGDWEGRRFVHDLRDDTPCSEGLYVSSPEQLQLC